MRSNWPSWISGLLLALALAGCRDDVLGPVPDDIRAFVRAEGLQPVRGSRVLLHLRADDVLLFSVGYGEPQDCPSGCFYRAGLGLRHGGRIGWIELDEGGVVWDAGRRSYRKDQAGYTYFAVAASDSVLFSERVLDQVATAGVYPHYTHYLAWHEATPEPALFRLAERLREHGSPSLAVLLVTHPNARCSSRLMELVLGAPGAVYFEVRELAEEMLQQMPAVCT